MIFKSSLHFIAINRRFVVHFERSVSFKWCWTFKRNIYSNSKLSIQCFIPKNGEISLENTRNSYNTFESWQNVHKMITLKILLPNNGPQYLMKKMILLTYCKLLHFSMHLYGWIFFALKFKFNGKWIAMKMRPVK